MGPGNGQHIDEMEVPGKMGGLSEYFVSLHRSDLVLNSLFFSSV